VSAAVAKAAMLSLARRALVHRRMQVEMKLNIPQTTMTTMYL